MQNYKVVLDSVRKVLEYCTCPGMLTPEQHPDECSMHVFQERPVSESGVDEYITRLQHVFQERPADNFELICRVKDIVNRMDYPK